MTTFTTADGLTLAYDDQGTGGPILCLAGLTRNMDDFEPVVEHFAARARIIRLDSRGRGASDHDPDFMNYTIPQEGADALALLDHLGLEKAAILGTSRGGLIAMALAITARDRLTGVLLNDIGPDIDPVGLAHIMDFLGRPSAYRSYEDAALRLPKAMGAQFPDVSHEDWLTYARRIWSEGEKRLELRYDPKLRDAIEAQSVTGALPDLWPLFDALDGLPLALLRGENSNLLSAETMAEMCRRRPDMIAATVGNRGHVPFLDEPESLNVITRFIDMLDEAQP
ncbi:alpha/beta fold hydrolase [Celeribacter neptunius]|uniref:Pimeloyl-ACP methyl ester carboxylesterase n=1 Tax=Celeribacter neptunius TaxID=588602 RepID=A0A1I3VDI0_9RHOB|nr:alpha/beta hydrolase [Celeribacter neptunius]SFJ93418.1 Pimeloyl-ACP methyl ester carboxylesterase [Celeribacter neptunius]